MMFQDHYSSPLYRRIGLPLLGGTALLISQSVFAQSDDARIFAMPGPGNSGCAALPSHFELQSALMAVAPDADTNGGLNTHMWATIVNRDGVVCAVAMTGDNRGEQWPGSRVISAQKANTANAFSLPGLALSTANLFSAVQPGGSLYGLQHSNPVNTDVAYGGNAMNYGQQNDPMTGGKIGGVNVFGGGLGLYDADGMLIGALGVSGDTSCADHNIAWRVRDGLGLDFVPAGVADCNGDEDGGACDNMIFDIADGSSAGGFGHPVCGISVDEDSGESIEPSINAAVVAACPVGDGSTGGC